DGDRRRIVNICVPRRFHQLLSEVPELGVRMCRVEPDDVVDRVDRQAGPARQVSVQVLVEVEEQNVDLSGEREDLIEMREIDIDEMGAGSGHKVQGLVEQ